MLWLFLHACSCGLGEPLHLLEQPGAAHRVVRQRRRPLRRRVDGYLLLGLRRHLNVKEILSLTTPNLDFLAMKTTRYTVCHIELRF